MKFLNTLLALCGLILLDKLKFESCGIRAGSLLQTVLLLMNRRSGRSEETQVPVRTAPAFALVRLVEQTLALSRVRSEIANLLMLLPPRRRHTWPSDTRPSLCRGCELRPWGSWSLHKPLSGSCCGHAERERRRPSVGSEQ